MAAYGPQTTYNDIIRDWRAEKFDPDDCIDLFARAGADYFTLTAKFSDGVALWPSDASGRNTWLLGPQRDLVGELFDAAERAGNVVKQGLYYGLTEFFNPMGQHHDGPTWESDLDRFAWGKKTAWKNPSIGLFSAGLPYIGLEPENWLDAFFWKLTSDYARDLTRPQLRELIQRYKPFLIWCDIGGADTYFQNGPVIADYYNMAELHRPEGVLINSRCGDETTHRDYETIEQGAGWAMEVDDITMRSETARTMGKSWGYDKNETSANVLNAKQIIRRLASAVSHNSNFLLNIGPRPDGTIPTYVRSRLLAVGKWLETNGESIKGTYVWLDKQDDQYGNQFTVGRNGEIFVHVVAPDDAEDEMLRDVSVEVPLDFPATGLVVTVLGDEAEMPLDYELDKHMVFTDPTDAGSVVERKIIIIKNQGRAVREDTEDYPAGHRVYRILGAENHVLPRSTAQIEG